MGDFARYRVPARIHRVEDSVERSRFVTTLAHAPTAEAARAFVERVREEFPDATHHCFAFVAGPPGSTAHIGMSDDGEPHGTAGRPMLNALLHADLGDVVSVCARWFGGVKLGTGGLSRAYTAGTKHALQSLPTAWRVERISFVVTLGYADVDAVQHLIEAHDVVIEEEEYGADVRFRCAVPATDAAAFRSAVFEATRGGAGLLEG